MKFLLINIYMFVIYLHQTSSTNRCTTADGATGQCVRPHLCKPINELRTLSREQLTLRDHILVTYSSCGRESNRLTDKVCCPHHRKPTLVSVPAAPCFTPAGVMGTCMNINLCPALADTLAAPVTLTDPSLIESSRCGNMEPYSFCCDIDDKDDQLYPMNVRHETGASVWSGEDAHAAVPVPGGEQCAMSAQPPDPLSDCCGLHAAEDRIVGGSVTGIDEYPWLAIIEYLIKETNSIEPGCGGCLISNRYVLTASHCLTGDILQEVTPASVRLGEYDLSNPGPDCVHTAGGGADCTHGPLVLPIEQIVPHDQYDPNNANRHHDIALIRLSKMAPYSDFIRPICLPTFDLTLNPPKDLRLYAAGWGMTNDQQKITNIKRAVALPYKPLSECESVYSVANVTLWRGQICAGGEKGKDSCKGDSGGPLMYKDHRYPYTVAAVINYGAKPCGQKDVPSVYTNVYVYLQWIYDQIVP